MSGSPNPFDFSDFRSQGSQFPDGGTAPGGLSGGFGGSPLDQRASFDPFADTSGPPPPPGMDSFGQPHVQDAPGGGGLFAPDEIAGPPVLWAGIAGAAALIGLALAILGSSSAGIAIAGWVIAGPVAIGLLAVYTALDTKQRTKPFYSQPGWAVYCYWVVLVIALAGVIVGALRIAYWAGTK